MAAPNDEAPSVQGRGLQKTHSQPLTAATETVPQPTTTRNAFRRDWLPDPRSYYEGQGLKLTGRGPWCSTSCAFHGSRSTMRINMASGGFICMSCCAKGGDIVAYHRAAYGLDFVDTCMALGAWQGPTDGAADRLVRPTQLSARDAIGLIRVELMVVCVAAANVGQGCVLTDRDRVRVMRAGGRVQHVLDTFQ
jgi:hypothetical protein